MQRSSHTGYFNKYKDQVILIEIINKKHEDHHSFQLRSLYNYEAKLISLNIHKF